MFFDTKMPKYTLYATIKHTYQYVESMSNAGIILCMYFSRLGVSLPKHFYVLIYTPALSAGGNAPM